MSEERKTPIKAIRLKCVDCSGGNTAEVRRCQVFDCPLWQYRMGQRPETLARKRPELLDPRGRREDGRRVIWKNFQKYYRKGLHHPIKPVRSWHTSQREPKKGVVLCRW